MEPPVPVANIEAKQPDVLRSVEKGYKPPTDTIINKGKVHNDNRAQTTREGAIIYKAVDGYALIGRRMHTFKATIEYAIDELHLCRPRNKDYIPDVVLSHAQFYPLVMYRPRPSVLFVTMFLGDEDESKEYSFELKPGYAVTSYKPARTQPVDGGPAVLANPFRRTLLPTQPSVPFVLANDNRVIEHSQRQQVIPPSKVLYCTLDGFNLIGDRKDSLQDTLDDAQKQLHLRLHRNDRQFPHGGALVLVNDLYRWTNTIVSQDSWHVVNREPLPVCIFVTMFFGDEKPGAEYDFYLHHWCHLRSWRDLTELPYDDPSISNGVIPSKMNEICED